MSDPSERSGLSSDPIDESSEGPDWSKVRRWTELMLRGLNYPADYEELGTGPQELDVAECVQLIATRIATEMGSDVFDQAGPRLVWSALVSEYKPENVPLSVGKVLLVYGWETLRDLRRENHVKKRCSCSGSDGAPDADTPTCEDTMSQHPSREPSPDSCYDPIMNREDMQDISIDTVNYMAAWKPKRYSAVDRDVDAQDVSNHLWTAIRRLIAENDVDNEVQTFLFRDIWQAIFAEGLTNVDRLGPGLLTCLLHKAWEDLVHTRYQNHLPGRCSHYRNEPGGTPLCVH